MDEARSHVDSAIVNPQLQTPATRRVTRLGVVRALLGGAFLTLIAVTPDPGHALAMKRSAYKRRKAPKRRKHDKTGQNATAPVDTAQPAPAPRPDPIIIEDPCEAFPQECHGAGTS